MKYFDRTFFRFTFGFLVIVAISLLIIAATSAYAAGVEQINFTTDPQTIKPDELSSPITIQTQDSSDNAYQTPETIDLELISNSVTGEFLSSTGNPATKYMNKNTANRTFYYRDSNTGVFTISVNAKGRDSGKEWNASQNINVSDSASASGNSNSSNPSGEVLGASSGSYSSSSQSSGGGTTNVSSLNGQLEVLAGNDRIISPGSLIWFQAIVKKNAASAGLELNWSFGDGNIGIGPLVSHSYKYSGDYAVILSAKAGDIFSVSRLKVKVMESNLSVADKGQYLEISNNGNSEINLFNWRLENNGRGFIFQPNTMILPRTSIKFDKSLLTMKGYENSLGTSLKNYLGEEIVYVAPIKEINMNEISQNLGDIEKKALAIQSKISNMEIKNKEIETNLVDSTQAITGAENIIYEAPKQEGLIAKLTNFIKRVFSD